VDFTAYRQQLLQQRQGEIALWGLVRNFSQWFFDLLRNFVLVGGLKYFAEKSGSTVLFYLHELALVVLFFYCLSYADQWYVNLFGFLEDKRHAHWLNRAVNFGIAVALFFAIRWGVSVIVADQVIAHFPRHVPEGSQQFGGNAVSLGWPGWTNRLVDLQIWGVQYSLARLTMLALGVAVGVALWLWLYQTKTGMVIRAGVDDRQMTSALGINIQVFFAIAFAVGAALVAMGAVVQSSQGNISQGQDGVWLLNSLVVVIIGGMGSLLGAVAGSLLFGLVSAFSVTYLPVAGSDCCTQYSPVLTFVLMALVLAFRPQGLFGRAA